MPSEEQIQVFREGIPDELKLQFEKVAEYSVRQGARGISRGQNRVVNPDVGYALALRAEAADKESRSDGLRDKAFELALEQIVEKAESDRDQGVVAVADPRIVSSNPQVRRDGEVYQAALTIEVAAEGYRKRDIAKVLALLKGLTETVVWGEMIQRAGHPSSDKRVPSEEEYSAAFADTVTRVLDACTGYEAVKEAIREVGKHLDLLHTPIQTGDKWATIRMDGEGNLYRVKREHTIISKPMGISSKDAGEMYVDYAHSLKLVRPSLEIVLGNLERDATVGIVNYAREAIRELEAQD